MTLDQINECLRHATYHSTHSDPVYGTINRSDINYTEFALSIAQLVRNEMLALTRANAIFSDDANELYKDLQAYDRFERGLNY